MPKYIKTIIASHLHYGDIMNLLSTCKEYAVFFHDESFWIYLIREHYNLSPRAIASYVKYRHLYLQTILDNYYTNHTYNEFLSVTIGDKIRVSLYDRYKYKFYEGVVESYKYFKFNNIVCVHLWWCGKSGVTYVLFDSKYNDIIQSGKSDMVIDNFFQFEYRLLTHNGSDSRFYRIDSLSPKSIDESKHIRRYSGRECDDTHSGVTHVLNQKIDSGKKLHWVMTKFG